MLVTRSRHGGRRHHHCLVLFVACLVVCGVSPFDCSRNSTVASLKKESVFDFKTSVVENEYIVVFNGYYSASTRSVFVRDALSSALDSWKIIPRHNPASDYPSDFSLVKLKGTSGYGVEALKRHPKVRSVTPQKRVERFLRSIQVKENQSDIKIDSDADCAEKDVGCWSQKWSARRATRSSLALVSNHSLGW
ncbi:PREDICTED: membrane-bound transcription factor site-1 protease-like [Acropora digitifera]|uniref:membrane-bound transcription factor site-1 protease-like n=1 Tax=Acropora digitifera TaxID=70779 RepID=UPI00077A1A78|nr:PREDICTED: membrane-bound transcription factor site-1 protease-like [Acropora digitifera]